MRDISKLYDQVNNSLVNDEQLAEPFRQPTFEGQLETEKNLHISNVASEAVREDPDQQARATKLSRDFNTDPELVKTGVDEFEQKKKQKELLEKLRTAEGAKKFLADFNNAAIAHDDADTLIGLDDVMSKTWWEKAEEQDAANNVDPSTQSWNKFMQTDVPSIAKSWGATTIANFEKGIAGLIQSFRETAMQEIPEERRAEYEDIFLSGMMPSADIPDELYQEATAVLKQVDIDAPITTEGGRLLSGAVASIAQQVPGLSMGILTGNAGLAVSLMGIQTYGQVYSDSVAGGMSPEDAHKNALIQGLAESGTELLPFIKFASILNPGKKLTKEMLEQAIQGQLKPGKKMGRKLAEYMLAEFPGEALATAIQQSSDIAFSTDPEKRAQEVKDYIFSHQFVEDQIDTFLQTLIQTSIMGSAGKTGNVLLSAAQRIGEDKDLRQKFEDELSEQQRKTRIEQQKIDQINSTIEQSKLKERDPETLRQFGDQITEESDIVYIVAKDLKTYLEQSGIDPAQDPAFQGIADKIDEAAQLETTVEIPMKDYMADIATNDQHRDGLRQHIRLSNDTMTQSEIGRVIEEQQNIIDAAMEIAEQEADIYLEAQSVFEEVKEQIFASGRVNEANAKRMAQLIPSWATVMAKKTGLSVREVYEQSGLGVKGPLAEKQADITRRQEALQQSVQDRDKKVAVLAALDKIRAEFRKQEEGQTYGPIEITAESADVGEQIEGVSEDPERIQARDTFDSAGYGNEATAVGIIADGLMNDVVNGEITKKDAVDAIHVVIKEIASESKEANDALFSIADDLRNQGHQIKDKVDRQWIGEFLEAITETYRLADLNIDTAGYFDAVDQTTDKVVLEQQGVDYESTETADSRVADISEQDGDVVDPVAQLEAIKQAAGLDRTRLPEQTIVTIKEAQDWLEANGFPRIAPQGDTASLISDLQKNEAFQQLNIFDQIRVAAQLERPIRKRDYNSNMIPKANRKLSGAQAGNVRTGANQKVEGSGTVAADTIRGCDHFCFECYALKGAAQAAISHQHPVLQKLSGTIRKGELLRIGETGDPSKNWAWTDEQVRSVIEKSQKRDDRVDFDDVFYITKLLNLDGFNPETARNLQVTLDPLMPAHMWISMENIVRLMSSHPEVNINVRIRSVASNNADINDAMSAAVEFANQFKLPIIETRMRFIRKSSQSLLELDMDRYKRDGNQLKLTKGELKEQGDQALVCDEKGKACPGCLGCAKTTKDMRKKNLKNQQKVAKDEGIDGIDLAETAPLFDPVGGEGLLYQQVDDLGFYSQLSEEIPKSIFDQKQLKGSQVLKKLDKAIKSGKVKQDEVDAVGLKEFLELNKDETLTPEQVQSFVDGNGVAIEEVTKGFAATGKKTSDNVRDLFNRMQPPVSERTEQDEEFIQAIGLDNDELDFTGAGILEEVVMGQTAIAEDIYDVEDSDDLPQWVDDYFTEMAMAHSGQAESAELNRDTKYSEYTLPGGENYREVLLTLPGGQFTFPSFEEWQADIDPEYTDLSTEEQREIYDEQKKWEGQNRTATKTDQDFKSSHWDELNILAHMRLNDREVNGERVLFIEEIQSDWALEGRKSGFKTNTDPKIDELRRLKDQVRRTGNPNLNDKFNNLWDEVYEEYGVDDSVPLDEFLKQYEGTTPSAPFVTSSAWQQLVLKRIMRMAAEGGYDRVSWVTGEQTAERYSLDKKLDSISVSKKGDDLYDVAAYGTDSQVDPIIEEYGVTADRVERLIGKETADRAIKNITSSGADTTHLENQDLKIEAKWARNLYDKAVPNFMQKFGKKYGVKTEVVEPSTGTQQLSLQITEQMRDDIVTKGLPLFQGQKITKGTFDPTTSMIRLTEASDLSTFLHESAHFFLEMEQRLNPEGMVAINEWFKRIAPDIAEEAGVTEEMVNRYIDDGTTGIPDADQAIYRARHEQFARGFEKYLNEGTAPSLELREAFRAFARWITDVYRKLRGRERIDPDLVKLDDEMRKVFDRMLATEEQIAAAEASDRYQALFTDAAMAGMTEEEFAAYQKKQQAATDKANETLREKLLKELQRETKKWWNEEKRDRVTTIIDELKERKVYTAIEELRKKGGELKMDRVAVRELLGVDKIPPQLRNMTVTGGEGVTPDDAAAFLGYESGSEMVQDIMKTRNINEVANEQAEAEMKAEHGDILNDGTLEQQAQDAAHNEERGKLILIEMKKLAKSQNRPAIDRKIIKQLATENIGRLPLNKLRPAKYRRAEIKAAVAAQQALQAGDQAAALRHKTQQAMNFYLWRAATDAQTQADKIVRYTRKFNKKSTRTELAKAGNGYLEQIDGILNRFQFTGSVRAAQARREEISVWAAERAEAGDNIQLTQDVLSEQMRMHYKEVPFETLLGIYDSIRNIDYVARFANKVEREGEKIAFQELKREILEHLDQLPTKFTPSVADTTKQTKGVRWHLAKLTKMPMLFTWLDGGKRVGLMHNLLAQPFTDAAYKRQQLYKEVGQVVADAVRDRSKEDKKRHNAKVFVEQAVTDVNDGNFIGHQILAVALNTGNLSNLEKMLKGEGWIAPDAPMEEVSVNNPQLQAVLSHMTESDWTLVELIWEQIDKLYPSMAEVHKKSSGLDLAKVEAAEFTLPNGRVIKGGYYPVKYDPSRDQRAQMNEEKMEAMLDSAFGPSLMLQPSATTGAKIERTSYFAPIRFNTDVMMNHVDEVIQYISHYDAVRLAHKITSDPQIRAAITEKVGKEEYAQIAPWLNDIAKEGRAAPSKGFFDPALRRLRFGMTLGMMGFKASTGLMQISGLSNTAGEVGAGYTAKGLRTVISGVGSPTKMKENWQFVTERSKIMADRINTMDRELMNAMQNIQGKTGLMKMAQEASMKHIAYIQTYMVDLPTWYAAYYKGIDEAMVEIDMENFDTYEDYSDALDKHAAKRADWTVENVQGSGMTKDMAAVMRNQSEAYRMMTMFFTFFSSMWQMQRDMGRGIKSGRYGATTIAAKLMFIYAIPVAYEMLLRGDLEDDDDRTWYEKYLAGLAMYPAQTVPVVRDVVNALGTDYDFNLSPIQSILDKGLKANKQLVEDMVEGDVDESSVYVWKNATKLGGAALGVPGVSQAWNTGEHIYDVIEEGEDLTMQQLLFGPKR